MSCKECESYIPSEKFAGGRCNYLGGNAKFPDDPCSASATMYTDDKTPQLTSLFAPKGKPKKAKPDVSMLGEDPQDTYDK